MDWQAGVLHLVTLVTSFAQPRAIFCVEKPWPKGNLKWLPLTHK